MGTVSGSRRKLEVLGLSIVADLGRVRNSSSTLNAYRMTTWEGERKIPIRASSHRNLTGITSQPSGSADQTNVFSVGTNFAGNKKVAPG